MTNNIIGLWNCSESVCLCFVFSSFYLTSFGYYFITIICFRYKLILGNLVTDRKQLHDRITSLSGKTTAREMCAGVYISFMDIYWDYVATFCRLDLDLIWKCVIIFRFLLFCANVPHVPLFIILACIVEYTLSSCIIFSVICLSYSYFQNQYR